MAGMGSQLADPTGKAAQGWGMKVGRRQKTQPPPPLGKLRPKEGKKGWPMITEPVLDPLSYKKFSEEIATPTH